MMMMKGMVKFLLKHQFFTCINFRNTTMKTGFATKKTKKTKKKNEIVSASHYSMTDLGHL